MDAIVIAGGIPSIEDPLYAYTQGEPKAFLDINGKPMIQWVFDALDAASTVERVVVVGLSDLRECQTKKWLATLPSQGGILENIRAGVIKLMEINPGINHVLVVSSDIPGLTPGAIDWVVQTVSQSDEDVYYCVITRQVMEARYPHSRRSYARLQDMEVCGGDMNVVRAAIVMKDEELWHKIIASRKNVLKQAALLGYTTLFLLLLRRITLTEAVARVTRRLGLSGRAIVCPYAEVGMDVDKPHQLEIMRQDLAQKAQE